MWKRWEFWLGAAVSAFFLYLALKGLKLDELWGSLKTAQYSWLLPGVAVYFVAVWARVWRWHYLLGSIKRIPMRQLWPPMVIGYMGNNIYPFRAGELLRAYVLKRKEDVSMAASLATILVERIFDGLVMLVFVAVALPTVPNLPAFLRNMVIVASVAFAGALIVLMIWAVQPKFVQKIYSAIITRLFSGTAEQNLLSLADNFTDGLRSLSSIKDVTMVFISSLTIWLLETVKYWFVMHAFPFAVSFFALMLMNGVVNLATTLPSAPGYVGTFDTPGIEVLKVFGIDPIVATSYTLVLHAALWLPITLLGFYYMAKESLSWTEFKQIAEKKNAELEDVSVQDV